MCQCTPTPIPGNPPPIDVPGACFDLETRLDSVIAVADCALNALPRGLQGWELIALNQSADLIAAVTSLLDLCKQDVIRLETQLTSPTPQGA